MKKALILIALVLAGQLAWGQDRISVIRQKLETGRATLSYKYTVNGKVPVGGSGTLIAQGDCYIIEGNGLKIVCDGESQWTIDPEAKEVYIEPSEGAGAFLAHPEAILDNSSNLKVGDTEISGIYNSPDSDAKISFRLWNIKFAAPGKDLTEFVYDADSLDSSWVVTDLR